MILPAHLAGVAERDIALQVLQMLVEAHAMPADERQMNRQCSDLLRHLPLFLRNALPRDALIRKIERAGSAERRRGMNANSGEPWSEMDLWELKTSMKYRRSFAEVAGFLYRDEEEVRDMAKALGLSESVNIGKRLRWVPTVGGSEEQWLPI